MPAKREIYLDHAATTAVRPEVVEAMLPYFTKIYGNPSSIYAQGREARKALDQSREKVASILGSKTNEVIFTGSGTEADNLAIRGVAWANRNKRGNHIITTKIEHHAVLHTVEQLEKHHGFEVTYLPVDRYGQVNPDDVGRAIKDTTVLVSVMYANNEVGTIEPIAEIGKITRAKKVLFHTDAVQAAGALDVDVSNLGVDLMSIGAHKFYGPKGIGALYVRAGTSLETQITGGAQERHRRSGTENVPYIVALATAFELAQTDRENENARQIAMRDRMIKGIQDRISRSHLTGHPANRLPNSVSFCFDFIEGESILLNLDMLGVAASSGSACTSASLDPSHVLLACDVPIEIAHGSLRLTLGRDNTEADVDYVLDILPGIVEKMRAMSPLAAECAPTQQTSQA